jgi:hypothetical protein
LARTSAVYVSQIDRGRRRSGRRLLAKLAGHWVFLPTCWRAMRTKLFAVRSKQEALTPPGTCARGRRRAGRR